MKNLLTKKESLQRIYSYAGTLPKGSYSLYESMKQAIDELQLSSQEYTQAVRKLAQVMEV